MSRAARSSVSQRRPAVLGALSLDEPASTPSARRRPRTRLVSHVAPRGGIGLKRPPKRVDGGVTLPGAGSMPPQVFECGGERERARAAVELRDRRRQCARVVAQQAAGVGGGAGDQTPLSLRVTPSAVRSSACGNDGARRPGVESSQEGEGVDRRESSSDKGSHGSQRPLLCSTPNAKVGAPESSGALMPKYLFEASYTLEGVKGVQRGGGT